MSELDSEESREASWLKLLVNPLEGFPGGSVIKNPPTNARNMGSVLCWEDPLEEKMATHSNILVWRVPWTEEPGRLQSMGLKRVGHD